MRRIAALMSACALAVLAAGCGEDDEPVAEPAAAEGTAASQGSAVDIADFKFGPEAITVAAGGEVTWTNTDSAAHTASGADGSFDTGALDKGEEAEVAFDEPGTYEYICEFHPFMKGTIEVG
jgi:plastocyanin